jgi:hypothetical protein
VVPNRRARILSHRWRARQGICVFIFMRLRPGPALKAGGPIGLYHGNVTPSRPPRQIPAAAPAAMAQLSGYDHLQPSQSERRPSAQCLFG